MRYEFKSAVSRGGGVLTPQVIIVTEDAVTLKQRNTWLIGTDSTTIPRDKISSIQIDDKVWGVNIFIYSVGNSRIVGRNFTSSDAKKIKQLLESKPEQSDPF